MRIIRLSDSCTTGWSSWGHGELWLTPDSIVRIGKKSLTRKEMLRGGLIGGLGGGALAGALVATMRTRRPDVVEVTDADWERELRRHRTVLQIPLATITEADLKRGLITSCLDLVLGDGTRHKLLWKRNRMAVPLLRQALGPSLRSV